MTADEAVAAGFADQVGIAAAQGETEPDPADPNEGDENDPEDRGDAVVWNGVAFPKAALPQVILAKAKPRPQPAAKPQPVLALVPSPEPSAPITRAELKLRAPALLDEIIAEGHAAGVLAERTRLKAIDDLGVVGCSDLVAAAKYGDKPTDAPTLAMEVVRAGKHAGTDLLAQRRADSAALKNVKTSAPDQTKAGAEARLIQAITDGGNARRGGGK
jgi:hypothetical protein